MKLDSKDKQLLDLLYLNSRESLISLGKKLKLSPSAVERRLQKLISEGVISLLFADVNLGRIGLKSYRIYMKFDVIDEKTEKEILTLFENYSRTLWGVVCEGEYDILFRFIAKDEYEVEDVIEMFLKKFGERIVEKTVITTTSQTYLSWNKAFGSERRPALPFERMEGIENIDEVDLGILSELYGNARQSTVNIAKKVGLTPDAVQYRIKKLIERKLILGYTAWYDAKKLEFNYYKILIGFRNITKDLENEFMRFCTERDEVIFINKTIGSWDVEVDIIVEDNRELHRFIMDMKTKFGHILGKHTFISAIEERMLNPLRGELENKSNNKKK